jgi:signal peptidase I
MHHPGNFISNFFGTQNSFNSWWISNEKWYISRNITKEQAQSWNLRGGLEKGDIVLIRGAKNLKIGDIIIFNANQANPIIHRIISIQTANGQSIYSTKGDNNQDQLAIEKNISQSQIIGKATLRIPKLGWLKLFFVELFRLL